jgi:DNA transposition AAA+ family ATPase
MRERILKHLESTGKSRRQFAREIGVSDAMVSGYISGTYPNPETLEKKAREYFALIEKPEVSERPPRYVETSISGLVYDTIEYSHVNHCISFVTGGPGIGKTKAAMKYARDFSETIYIPASTACKSLKDLYRMIARSLRISDRKSLMELQEDIRAKLDGSSKLLIIDEAQHLVLTAIDGIRALNDGRRDFEDEDEFAPVGIVFIGNHLLKSQMEGRRESEYDQIFSRIQMQQRLFTKDVRLDDIRLLFPMLVARSMEKEIEFLHTIARSRRGIRGAVNIFLNASKNGDVTFAGLSAATRTTGIGIAG